MNKYCVGYQRVSSQEQISNYSLENQEEYIRGKAKELGYKLLKIFSDPGHSAKDTKRPGLIKMLDFCRKNKDKVSAVVIYKIDRLSRSTIDYLSLKMLLAKSGVKIVSCTEPLEEGPAGEFVETLLAATAKFDNAMKSQRTLDGIRKRVEKGWHPAKPPLGYKTKAINEQRIVIKNQYFDLMKKAWLEIAKGIYSSGDIAKMMNKWGIRTTWRKEKKTITEKQVLRTFRDKFYMGIIETERWGVFKGRHPKMIDEETFFKVQSILDGKSPAVLHYRRDNPAFPLRHFYKCKTCGRFLTGAFSRGRSKKYPYYFCLSHRGENFKRRLAQQKFIKLLKGIKPKKEYVDLFCEVLKEKYLERIKTLSTAQKIIEKEIKELESKKQKLVEKNLAGVYDDRLFKEQMERLEEEIIVKKTLRSEKKIEKLDIDILIKFMKNFLVNLDRAWVEGGLKQRQLIQGSIFPEGLVYQNLNYRTVKLSYPFKLICRSDTLQKTSWVTDGN